MKSLQQLQEEFQQRQKTSKKDVASLSTSCSEESLGFSDFSAEPDSPTDLGQESPEPFRYCLEQLLGARKVVCMSDSTSDRASHLFTVQAFGPDATLATLDLPPGLTRSEDHCAYENGAEASAADLCINISEGFHYTQDVGEFVPGESFMFSQQASEFVPMGGLCLNACETEQSSHQQAWEANSLLFDPQATEFMPALPGWESDLWSNFGPHASDFMPGHQASDLEHAFCFDEQLVPGTQFNPQALEFVPGKQSSDLDCTYNQQASEW